MKKLKSIGWLIFAFPTLIFAVFYLFFKIIYRKLILNVEGDGVSDLIQTDYIAKLKYRIYICSHIFWVLIILNLISYLIKNK